MNSLQEFQSLSNEYKVDRLQEYKEKVTEEGFRTFMIEMKKSYAFANMESQWESHRRDSTGKITVEAQKSFEMKLRGMFEQVKHIPFKALPDVFKHARQFKEIPTVTALIKSWKTMESFWKRHELEQLQDMTLPQLKPRQFNEEAHEELKKDLKRLGLVK